MSTESTAASGLTEEQVADLKEAFAMFDINGDGECLPRIVLRIRKYLGRCRGAFTVRRSRYRAFFGDC
jgi:hypothetical protein